MFGSDADVRGVMPAETDGGSKIVRDGEVTIGPAKGDNRNVNGNARCSFDADNCNEAEIFCGLCVEPAEGNLLPSNRTLPPALGSRPNCVAVSRFCLLSGAHCRLPADADGTPYHSNNHNAYATAEMCRPYS